MIIAKVVKALDLGAMEQWPFGPPEYDVSLVRRSWRSESFQSSKHKPGDVLVSGDYISEDELRFLVQEGFIEIIWDGSEEDLEKKIQSENTK